MTAGVGLATSLTAQASHQAVQETPVIQSTPVVEEPVEFEESTESEAEFVDNSEN